MWHDEQATFALDSVCGTAADDLSRHRFSEMSPRELMEHLEALRAEDIDLDGALVNLRASQGDYQVPGPGRPGTRNRDLIQKGNNNIADTS